MIVHANSLANNMPTISELDNLPPTIMRTMVQTFANVNVDVFVLISGWFGLKFSVRGVVNILFQCIFYTFLSVCLVLWGWSESFSVTALLKSLYFGSCYWFVVAYLGLMVLSPILNMFVEHASRKTLKYFLVIYFVYECIYGWVSLDEAHFINGYSFVSFIGLYLLARYVKLYKPRICCFGKYKSLGIYIACSFLSGMAIFVMLLIGNETMASIVKDKMLAYNSPLCMCAALFLLLSFSRINLGTNKVINWLASSCFAIYLLHCNSLILPHYLDLMHNMYLKYDGIWCVCMIFYVILSLAFIIILVDKPRLFIYKSLCKNKKYYSL